MLYIILVRISCFPFFAKHITCCLFQTRNDVRKKANSSNFLFEFKMAHKAAETTHNINNAFDPGTADEPTVQSWFKKIWKGEESLEVEAGHWNLTTTTERHH